MTDLRKAAEMALNALKISTPVYSPHKFTQALKALEAALAQPEQEHIECGYDETVGMCTNNPCCEQAQPEQEPVAWQVMVENEPMREFTIKEVAHDWTVTEKRNGSKYSYWIRPLYTAPPRKPWQGLTSEDWENTPDTGKQGCERDAELFDWIEQTLKDKNDTF